MSSSLSALYRPLRRTITGLKRAAFHSSSSPSSSSSSPSSSSSSLLSASSCIPPEPTWSTRTLTSAEPPPQDAFRNQDPITPHTLHHLLRLSALPPPRTPQEESSLLGDLRTQLRFVRHIQARDTSSVEPLTAIRDETDAARREATFGPAQLAAVLGEEVAVGHYNRPRRVRGKPVDTAGVEDWDPLKTASRKSGRYFMVKSGRDAAD